MAEQKRLDKRARRARRDHRDAKRDAYDRDETPAEREIALLTGWRSDPTAGRRPT